MRLITAIMLSMLLC